MFAHLVAEYGYLVIAATVLIEGLGFPVPGETTLVAGAAIAASGRLSLLGVIIAATGGAILGGSGGYWIGRAGGLPLLERHGRFFHVDAPRLERARGFFSRHGAKTIVVARFVALLRIVVGIAAGVMCMPFARFTVANAVGGFLWAITFGALGYAFGHNLPALEAHAAQVAIAATLALALAVLLWLAVRAVHTHQTAISERTQARWRWVVSHPRLARFRSRHKTLWTFVAARFARGEYLGLHLTIGFVVSVGALWLFGGVTEDVVHHDPLTQLDLQIAEWFRSHATHALDRLATAISIVGAPAVVAAIGLTVTLVLLVQRRWIVTLAWVVAFAGSGILDWSLKRIIQRPRPTGSEAFLYGTSFSFPSGHALGSLVVYGMLAYLVVAFIVHSRRARLGVSALAAFLVAAIGLSRLYLGVHYLSDVIGGFAVATVWLSVCVSGLEITLGQRGLYPWHVGFERRREPREALQ